MAVGVALACTGVIPSDCAAYDPVWRYVMPLAASTYIVESDVSQLASTGGPTAIAFLVGAVGMTLGAVVGGLLLARNMGSEGPKLAACLCASYIGGSVNFAAVAKAISLSHAVIPAAMAVDSLAMAGFLAVLATVNPGWEVSSPPAHQHGSMPLSPPGPASPVSVTAESLALACAAGALACWLGEQMSAALRAPSLHLLLVAVVASALGLLGPRMLSSALGGGPVFAGASLLGSLLMAIFFVIIGCSAGSLTSLTHPGASPLGMLGFTVVMVAVHWAVMLVVNAALRLPLDALIIGSNACLGGPATAVGMAVSKGWRHLVQPAMLTGSAGYAIGTLAGLCVARCLAAA